MMRVAPGRLLHEWRTTAALAAACGCGLAALWIATSRSDSNRAVAARQDPAILSAPAPTVLPPAPTPKAAFAEIAERPLFESTRRPFIAKPAPASLPPAPVVAAPPPAPPPAPTSLRGTHMLVGVVVIKDSRIALLKPVAAPDVLRVAEGDTVQGWTVRRIVDDRILLQAGGSEDVLAFPDPKTLPVASGAVPPAVPPMPMMSQRSQAPVMPR